VVGCSTITLLCPLIVCASNNILKISRYLVDMNELKVGRFLEHSV